MKKQIFIGLAGVIALAVLALAACATYNEFTVAGGAYGTFKNRCSACHGLQGQGIPPAGPQLKGSKFITDNSVDDIKEVIRMGRHGASKEYDEYLTGKDYFMNMPGFSDRTIPDADLDVLAKWLKDGMQMQ